MKKILFKSAIICLLGLASCKSKQVVVSENGNEKVVFDEKAFSPYFKALGTEPFWNIEIGNNFIVYKNIEGEMEIFPYSDDSFGKNSTIQKINASNQNHKIQIEITKESCSDGMSDNSFDFKTLVTISGKSLNVNEKGCGNYIVPKSLQGKWELFQFNGTEIPANKYLKTPYIEFENEEKHISGNASCNGISSEVYIDKETLRFSKTAVTKMMCVHENMETEFLKELPTITKYKIENNELQLFAGNSLKMKFRKTK